MGRPDKHSIEADGAAGWVQEYGRSACRCSGPRPSRRAQSSSPTLGPADLELAAPVRVLSSRGAAFAVSIPPRAPQPRSRWARRRRWPRRRRPSRRTRRFRHRGIFARPCSEGFGFAVGCTSIRSSMTASIRTVRERVRRPREIVDIQHLRPGRCGTGISAGPARWCGVTTAQPAVTAWLADHRRHVAGKPDAPLLITFHNTRHCSRNVVQQSGVGQINRRAAIARSWLSRVPGRRLIGRRSHHPVPGPLIPQRFSIIILCLGPNQRPRRGPLFSSK